MHESQHSYATRRRRVERGRRRLLGESRVIRRLRRRDVARAVPRTGRGDGRLSGGARSRCRLHSRRTSRDGLARDDDAIECPASRCDGRGRHLAGYPGRAVERLRGAGARRSEVDRIRAARRLHAGRLLCRRHDSHRDARSIGARGRPDEGGLAGRRRCRIEDFRGAVGRIRGARSSPAGRLRIVQGDTAY